MKTRFSVFLIALAFLFLSCGSSLSQGGEGYVTVDVSEVVQKLASRSAGDGQTATVTLRTEGDYVTSVTETVSTSGGSIKLDNLPIGKTITIALETTIAHKYFEGSSDPLLIQEGNNQVTIKLAKAGISTDYVLYDYNDSGYSYYLSKSANTTGNLFKTSDRELSFTFDNDGNCYMLILEGDDEYSIISDAFSESISIGEFNYVPSIVVDSKTNIMYAWYVHERELVVKKYPNLIADHTVSETTSISITVYAPYITIEGEPIELWPDNCTVYNNVLYAIVRDGRSEDNVGSFLCKTDISNEVTEISLEEEDCINLGFVDLNMTETSIYDMHCQEGAVYMLTRCYSSDQYMVRTYSRGELIKYDIATGVLSYANAFAPGREMSTFTAACSFSDGTNRVIVYDSDDLTDYHVEQFTYGANTSSLSFKTPFNNSDVCFAGPHKFIAIKPKKLVISDTGLAFYTNADGAITYKNINRVIEVDLKTLSMINKTDAAVDFQSPYTYHAGYTSGLPDITVTSLQGKYKAAEDQNSTSQITSTSSKTLYPYFIKAQ